MMTGLEILEYPKNELINFWLECNPMTLNRMMLNVWMKWAIDLRRKKGQPDEDVDLRPTKYKVY